VDLEAVPGEQDSTLMFVRPAIRMAELELQIGIVGTARQEDEREEQGFHLLPPPVPYRKHNEVPVLWLLAYPCPRIVFRVEFPAIQQAVFT
jgi:hypothetical protein